MFLAFIGTEWLLVILVVVLLFGATRIPQLGDSLGKGIRNFRKAINNKEETKLIEEKQEEEKKEDS